MPRFLSFFLLLVSVSQTFAITGGKPVTTGTAPWTGALIDTALPVGEQCLESGGSDAFCQHYCGAVLISPDWALTAAHCVLESNRRPKANVKVILGEPDLNAAADRYGIEEVYRHPEYPENVSVTYSNDIALLKLDRSSTVRPASLARPSLLDSLEQNASTLNDSLDVFGWGRLQDSNDAYPNRLQRVAIDIQSPGWCDDAAFFVSDLMICVAETNAGAIERDDAGDATPRDPDGEGPCHRDSGGPLVHYSDGTPFVGGLVSWGVSSDCGDPAAPDVATRVPRYLPWLEKTSRDNQPDTPLINPAVEIQAPASTSGTTQALTVVLANRNHKLDNGGGGFTAPNPIDGLGFELSWDGSGTLAMINAPSPMNCTPEGANSFSCLYGTMSEQSAAQTQFELTGLAPESTGTLAATAIWNRGQDYQSASGRDSQALSRTTKPDLELTGVDAVAEALGSGGRLEVFLTLSNSSAHVDANDVRITLTPPSDHIPEDLSGLDCSATLPIECTLGTLSAGEQRLIGPLRFSSAGADDGTLIIEATAGNGDFPTGDTRLAQATSYPENPAGSPLSPSPAQGPDLSSGGALGAATVLLLLMAGWRQHARQAAPA